MRTPFAVADPGFSPGGVRQLPKVLLFFKFFAENCMKMKEFGPPGGARVPGAPLGSANDLAVWCQCQSIGTDPKDSFTLEN